ncbi:class III lanthionine synthetase LanKC [Gorillibacterium sp. CAU 1737]|uniref:class III lanthionine synthetase LanKC n=1 Tax=Gorillibacterium sp. CAU 1737 TaxID=3140362 RepID=UPI0032605136
MEAGQKFYHLNHLAQHPEFYESFDSYQPSDEFLDIIRSVTSDTTYHLHRRGIWRQVTPTDAVLINQGWKIHLSARSDNGEEILRIAARICLERSLAFKFALDKKMLVRMTSKGWGRESGGKFITIYPAHDEQFKEVITLLGKELASFEGPYILSDKRFPGSQVVHYRYGGIKGEFQLTERGTKEYTLRTPDNRLMMDERVPFWNPPYWVEDPFPDDDSDVDLSLTLNEGRYEVHSSLLHSLAGGVYLATDLDSGTAVVIKEARKHIGVDEHGDDAVARLEKEYALLEQLADTGITPKPVELFHEWEHTFLVEEYLLGPTLGKFTSKYNPFITGTATDEECDAFLEILLRIWKSLAQAVNEIHERGIALGDLSMNNIIVSNIETGSVKILDLEAAWEIGKGQADATFGTPGFRPKRPGMDKQDDIYALGANFLGMIFPTGVNLYQLEPELLEKLVDLKASELGLPNHLRQLIIRSLNEQAERRPSLLEMIDQVSTKPEADHHSPFRQALDRQELLKKRDDCLRYILSTADPSRADRLFPSDPMVFHTNPLSLSYGAAGVGYAITKLTGNLDKPVREWMADRSVDDELYTPGLYVGASGIAWSFWEMGLQEQSLEIMKRFHSHPLLKKTPDLFYGASGYGLACLHFHMQTGDQEWLDKAVEIGDWLLATKEVKEDKFFWRDPEGSVNLGYALGASGIALYLLYLGQVTTDPKFLAAAQAAVEHEISYLVTLPRSMGLPRGPVGTSGMQIISPYWFEGNAGLGTSLLRFWRATGDSRYFELMTSLSKENFMSSTAFCGLFRGVTGIGNYLLDAYQFTGDEDYLQKAMEIGTSMNLYGIERPGGLAFPGDQAYRISTDFGTGSAGVALFYHRLAHADQGAGNYNFTLDQLISAPQLIQS